MRVVMPTLLPALGPICVQAQVDAVAPESAAAASLSVPEATGAATAGRGAGLFGPAGPGVFGTASGRTFRITPRVSVIETLTDNVRLSSTDRRAEAVTQASAGVQLVSTGGRLRGYADYALSANYYARGSASSTLQNALSANLTGELVERRAFVDFSAAISQQSISAFGTQSTDTALANANRTEVRTYRVSPYLRGQLSTLALYELRAAHGATHVVGSSAGDVTSSSASALLTGTRSGRVNWSANAAHSVIDDSSGLSRQSDVVNGALHFTPLPELRLSLLGGRESNNYLTPEKTSRTTYGARLVWTPTPRTTIVAERQQTFFGESHVLSLAHRMQRSSVMLSDTSGVYINGLQGDGSLRTTLYDLYDLQFTRLEPDPVLRQALVTAYLLRNNLAPGTVLPAGLLTSATSKQRAQNLSYTWFGLRDTLSVFVTRTSTERLDNRPAIVAGDFASFTRIRQQGVGLTLSHRLTPQSGLSATFSQQRNFGDASTGADQGTRLQGAYVSWSTQLSRWVSASMSARHTRFESTVNSYRESAVIGNLNLRF